MSQNQLIENPAELLREVRESFAIDQDTNSLTNIRNHALELRNKSKEQLDLLKLDVSKKNSELDTRKLATQLYQDNLKIVKENSSKSISKEQLAQNFLQLQELESQVSHLRGNLDRKVSDLVTLERQLSNSAEAEKQLNEEVSDPVTKSNILKLNLYRSLGVIVDSDNDQVLIDSGNGVVDTLPLDKSFSKFFITKYIWDKMKERPNNL